MTKLYSHGILMVICEHQKRAIDRWLSKAHWIADLVQLTEQERVAVGLIHHPVDRRLHEFIPWLRIQTSTAVGDQQSASGAVKALGKQLSNKLKGI